MDVIASALVIYLVIPCASFKRSCYILIRHEFGDDGEKLVDLGKDIYIDSEWLPGWRGFEFIGEAVPQLILSITFMVNNIEFMMDTATMFGANEYEMTLTSIIFSIGSILMGLYPALPVFIDIYKHLK